MTADPQGAGAILGLLEELQALDRVPRIGYAMRGVPEPESVSEHSFHVVFLVWALARQVPGLDVLRAVELALVHDLAEVRFGDLPRPAAHYLPAGAKQEAELRAVADLLAPLGSDRTELLGEYQAGETLEARFVSVCDKLQLLIKAGVYDRWRAGDVAAFGRALDEPSGGDGSGFDDGGFAVVRQLVDELRRRRAGGRVSPARPIGISP